MQPCFCKSGTVSWALLLVPLAWREGEIRFAALPLITDFHDDGASEPQARHIIWEDTHDSCAPSDFTVDSFQAIGGSNETPMALWEGKYA